MTEREALDPVDPADPAGRPAFYAAGQGPWRDWWTLLHPPYTAWHLSYVVIGACLAPVVSVSRLVATLLAFFFAVGVAAHALDELHGRPLRTRIPTTALVAAVVVGLAAAVALGIAGVVEVGWPLVPLVVLGPFLVVSYNAELFGGVVHTDAGFAAAWGAFPLLTAYVAQTGTLRVAPVVAAAGAPRAVGRPAQPEHSGPTPAPPGPGRARVGGAGRRNDDGDRPRRPAGSVGEGAAGHVVGNGAGRRGAGCGPAHLTAIPTPWAATRSAASK